MLPTLSYHINSHLHSNCNTHKNTKAGKIYNFYNGLITELGTTKIPVDSWDMLIELYFQGQRDNIGAEYGSDAYKRDENKFLATYEKNGNYSCHATLFQPKAEKKEVSQKRKQSEQDQFDFSNHSNQLNKLLNRLKVRKI